MEVSSANHTLIVLGRVAVMIIGHYSSTTYIQHFTLVFATILRCVIKGKLLSIEFYLVLTLEVYFCLLQFRHFLQKIPPKSKLKVEDVFKMQLLAT